MINNAIALFLIFAKARIAMSSQNQSVIFWHAICNIQCKTDKKGDNKMNTKISRKTAYIGAGAGIVLFAIFGLLPGSPSGRRSGNKISRNVLRASAGPGNHITRNRARVHAGGRHGVRNHDRNCHVHHGLALRQSARGRARIGKDIDSRQQITK